MSAAAGSVRQARGAVPPLLTHVGRQWVTGRRRVSSGIRCRTIEEDWCRAVRAWRRDAGRKAAPRARLAAAGRRERGHRSGLTPTATRRRHREPGRSLPPAQPHAPITGPPEAVSCLVQQSDAASGLAAQGDATTAGTPLRCNASASGSNRRIDPILEEAVEKCKPRSWRLRPEPEVARQFRQAVEAHRRLREVLPRGRHARHGHAPDSRRHGGAEPVVASLPRPGTRTAAARAGARPRGRCPEPACRDRRRVPTRCTRRSPPRPSPRSVAAMIAGADDDARASRRPDRRRTSQHRRHPGERIAAGRPAVPRPCRSTPPPAPPRPPRARSGPSAPETLRDRCSRRSSPRGPARTRRRGAPGSRGSPRSGSVPSRGARRPCRR